MALTVSTIPAANNAVQTEVKAKPREEASITFDEWWSGEKSLTSTAARYIGLDGFADWLEDKDKVCTDGKDDGKLSLEEGATTFAKGLIGGIPKAIIKHPLISAATVGIGVAAASITGLAATPILLAAGAIGVVGMGAYNLYNYVKADNDRDAKLAMEGLGTTAQSAVLVGASYKPTMAAAKQAGVNTDGNIIATLKSSAEVSAQNAKANYLTWKTGAIHANSNQARYGFEEVTQSSAPREAIKLDLSGTREEILARYPQLTVDEASGAIGIKTGWGFSKVDEHCLLIKYGEGDYNILSRNDCFKTYILSNGDGAKFDPATVEVGTTVNISKAAPGHYKVVPAGTKYVDTETVAGQYKTVELGSVLRKDAHNSPYASTANYMLENTVNLTPKQAAELEAVAAATK